MGTPTLELLVLAVGLVGITVILIIHAARILGPVLEDLFRGGPRPPTHPIPGNDSWLLNRRRGREVAQG